MWDIPAMVKWIAIASVAATLGYLGWSYKVSIEKAAILEQKNAQLEQIAEERQKRLDENDKINHDQLNVIDEAKKKNDELESKLESLEDYLNSEKGRKDSIKECVVVNKDGTKTTYTVGPESSEILKRTIRELSRQAQ
jgi:hypothetical protein